MSQEVEPRIVSRIASTLRRYVVAAIWVYYTLLFLWAAGYVVTGDRYPLIMILNNVAVHLFLPVPVAVVAAILTRRRELWIAAAISVSLFVALWGRLFLPRAGGTEAGTPALTVMSYNVRGYSEDVEATIASIERVDADVVLLQEVNHRLAVALSEELAAVYPYQVLDPYDDVRGSGVISRYPLEARDERLPLDWAGTPQILSMEWQGEQVTLVNFHMWAIGLGPLWHMGINARAREAQALYLADFALVAASEGPVIVAGDVNATPQSDTYRTITRWLEDSWLEAGYGLGHTYPGSYDPGSPWPEFYGIPVPRWLWRIDYVFHSADLEAQDAYTAPFDGASDHRGVVVVFTLRE